MTQTIPCIMIGSTGIKTMISTIIPKIDNINFIKLNFSSDVVITGGEASGIISTGLLTQGITVSILPFVYVTSIISKSRNTFCYKNNRSYYNW